MSRKTFLHRLANLRNSAGPQILASAARPAERHFAGVVACVVYVYACVDMKAQPFADTLRTFIRRGAALIDWRVIWRLDTTRQKHGGPLTNDKRSKCTLNASLWPMPRKKQVTVTGQPRWRRCWNGIVVRTPRLSGTRVAGESFVCRLLRPLVSESWLPLAVS